MLNRDDMNRWEAEIDFWRQRYEALLKTVADNQSLAPPMMLADKQSYELGLLHGAAAAMRQALEALEGGADSWQLVGPAIDALKAALAEHYCDNHCTWLDHAPGCVRAEPQTTHWEGCSAVHPECAKAEAERIRDAMQRLTDVQQKIQTALAEPVQEPVAWRTKNATPPVVFQQYPSALADLGGEIEPLYTAPLQRKPLTDEEILKAIGWDRAEMYMKLTPNFPVAEAKKETLKNARAIERAHGIGGNDE